MLGVFEFAIDAALLKSALKRVAPAVSASEDKALSCVLIEVSGSCAEFEARNTELSIRLSAPCSCLSDGAALVPHARLSKAVGKMSGMVAAKADGGAFTISCDGMRVTLPVLDPADRDPFPAFDSEGGAVLSSDDFNRCVGSVGHAVAKKASAPALGCIHMTASGGEASFDATDSYRVARATCGCSGEVDALLPPSVASMGFDGEVTVRVGGGKVEVSDGEVVVTSRTVAGKYPNIARFFSVEAVETAVVDAPSLASCVSMAGAFAQHARFESADGKMAVVAEGKDGERVMGEVPCDASGVFAVSLSTRFASECLARRRGEVSVGFVSELKPVMFDGAEASEIIMPIREAR